MFDSDSDNDMEFEGFQEDWTQINFASRLPIKLNTFLTTCADNVVAQAKYTIIVTYNTAQVYVYTTTSKNTTTVVFRIKWDNKIKSNLLFKIIFNFDFSTKIQLWTTGSFNCTLFSTCHMKSSYRNFFYHHYIAEILLKLALNTNQSNHTK
jgi:hypothetical protein